LAAPDQTGAVSFSEADEPPDQAHSLPPIRTMTGVGFCVGSGSARKSVTGWLKAKPK